MRSEEKQAGGARHAARAIEDSGRAGAQKQGTRGAEPRKEPRAQRGTRATALGFRSPVSHQNRPRGRQGAQARPPWAPGPPQAGCPRRENEIKRGFARLPSLQAAHPGRPISFPFGGLGYRTWPPHGGKGALWGARWAEISQNYSVKGSFFGYRYRHKEDSSPEGSQAVTGH